MKAWLACHLGLMLVGCASVDVDLRSPPTVSEPAAQYTQEEQPDLTLFGLTLAGLPDLDGDGVSDLAIGAPRAWSGSGRTGTVVVLSGATYQILRRIDGAHHGDWFGRYLTCMSAVSGTQLAVGYLGEPSGGERSERGGVSIIDLTGDRPELPLPRCGRLLGAMGDYDGDSFTDFMCERASFVKPGVDIYSGRDGAVITRNPIDGFVHLIPADYNGDGIREYVAAPGDGGRDLRVFSGLDGTELCSVSLDREYGWGGWLFQCTAQDVDSDGLPELITNSSDLALGVGRVDVYSRGCGERLVRMQPDGIAKCPSHWLLYQLLPLGGATGTGTPNFIVARGSPQSSRLRAYSLPSASMLWECADAYEENCSLAAWRDVDGDGVPEILAGQVPYCVGADIGGPGAVNVISGRTGTILKVISEADYPEIGLKYHEAVGMTHQVKSDNKNQN